MTHEAMLAKMEARAAAVRARAAVRSWEYRQRNLAAGAWFALRRTLADAREAYAISDDEAAALVAEGYQPEPSGRRIAPEKTIVFVEETRLAGLASRRPLRVGLGSDFLAAANVALVRFEGTGR